MRSAQLCRKAALVMMLAASGGGPTSVQAVTLDFSAFLTDGTCALSLDKSTLSLGTIGKSQLRPSRLIAPQRFTLFVRDCSGKTGDSLKPGVTITGSGVAQDNKWLFRNSGSAAGAGIVVIQSESVPGYDRLEVKHGAFLPLVLAEQIPVNQEFAFYAAASCGGNTGCASIGTGDVTASLMFTFAYQ